ncbi:hypothetical protein LEP1GSC123_0245 [Leptospira borgpetersenii str. 200701203]|uniref:Uncharacterized protein n=1 Tax=Leptospira borgpetersenii str. 200701203 TaxID=1193007 RepID=M3H416_LEPBO|nr:hypothetical protein LEP1GSC123_0245 [Leptospira borgpetersenii str. 200701203]
MENSFSFSIAEPRLQHRAHINTKSDKKETKFWTKQKS